MSQQKAGLHGGPGTTQIEPVADTPVMLSPSGAPEKSSLWRVTELRQVSSDQVEVIARGYQAGKDDVIARPAALPSVISAMLPDRTKRPASALGLNAVQFERLVSGQISHELEVSWDVSDGVRPQFWLVQLTSPEGKVAQHRTERPHFLIAGLATGQWHITVQARDWLSRLSRTAEIDVVIRDDVAQLVAPQNFVITPSPGALHLI